MPRKETGWGVLFGCHPSQSQSLPSPPEITASPEYQEPSGSRTPTLFRQQDAQALELTVPAASRRKKVETNFFMKSAECVCVGAL